MSPRGSSTRRAGTSSRHFVCPRGDEISLLELDPSLLPEGQHVIGVIVKQGGAASSDLSFDRSLDGHVRVALDPPSADAGVDPDGGRGGLDGGASGRDGAVVGPDGGVGGEDDGCGCRVGGGATDGRSWALGLAAGGLLVRRRRLRTR